MFARWNHARVRAAQRALRDGRLDEAFSQFFVADEKNSPAAQDLRAEIADALLARARLHARAARYSDAQDDLRRLAELGCDEQPEVQELIRRVGDAARAASDKQQAARMTADEARAKLDAGRLDSGRHAIRQVTDERQRQKLAESLDARLARSEELLEQARAAAKADDLAGAVRCWQRATQQHGQTASSDAVAATLAEKVRVRVVEHFHAGELVDARALLTLGGPLASNTSGLDPAQRTLTRLEAAAAALQRRDFDKLRIELLKLSQELPQAKWLRKLEKHAAEVLEQHAALLASPLGLLADAVETRREFGTQEAPAATEFRTRPASDPAPARERLLLIDGTGTALLTSREVLRLGRMGSSEKLDVALPGDLLAHHATIHRDGEDYFLTAIGPTEVNQRPISRTLLRDGDRIQFGRNVRMVFARPSDRSGTATLKLSSRNRLADDVSMVVLFHETCLIGPQPSCHIRTREGRTQAVLFEQDGALAARRPGGVVTPLPDNQTIELDDLSLTLKRRMS